MQDKDKDSTILLAPETNKPRLKKSRFRLFEHSLLLKQTLISAWKSKLQLVILLLLTAFATSLITGAWISYNRIIEGENYLQLDDADFDAVLPYSSHGDITQIADQAFSLKLGRIYYQDSSHSTPTALYFDDTTIGQEIKPLNPSDLKIVYTKDDNKITGIQDFQWADPNRPVDFNLYNDNVKASMYGQLCLKAQATKDLTLKAKYQDAADQLYQDIFVKFTAPQILASLKDYFTKWIAAFPSDPILTEGDQKFNDFMFKNKINYRGMGPNDLRIPDVVDIAKDISDPNGVLATKLVKKDDPNPRVTSGTDNFGMNGQWMQIYRDFDLNKEPDPNIFADFVNQYSSPSNYNLMTDGGETSLYSFALANAAAALQNRSIHVVNQFVGTAGVDPNSGKSVSVKVVDLGLKGSYDDTNLKIFEGVYPSSRNEIAISPQYARIHNIKPGNTININNRPFIVSGIGGDAYNIYPTINELDPIPNTRTEFIAYVYSDAFRDESWYDAQSRSDVSLMYFLPWKNVSVSSFDDGTFNDYFQKTIFNDDKYTDRYQSDYNEYLIQKYVHKNPDYPSKYQLQKNLVIKPGDSQFDIYAKGRVLLGKTLQGFKYAAIIGVLFLTAIVSFITFLIVKKAIQKGQVSMGILKSSGYSTWRIILSYLCYPLLVLMIAIPIGWFVGLAVQVYFTEIFNTLFILPYTVVDFNVVPLFISILVICGFVLLTTLLTGYHLLQKGPLDLIKQTSDISIGKSQKVGWLQAKIKHNFKQRFILSLSKNNWKKIAVTSTVIAVATLSITATVSIPATINNMKNNYFKSQKYKNYYQYQTPIPNMPLSKYGLYAWNNLNNTNNEPFYPVSGAMPWPENIIINDPNTGQQLAYYNPVAYKKNKDNTSNLNDILHAYPNVTEQQREAIVKQLEPELLSQPNGPLNMNFLSWSYSWMGGKAFSNSMVKDLIKLDNSPDQSFSGSLLNFVTAFLPQILGVSAPGVEPSPEAIVEILKQVLPGYIRQILDGKGPNAYDYFSIGHNTVAYNPNYDPEIKGPQEELVTQLQLASDNANLVNDGLLDVEGINPETKMLVMNSGLAQGLKYDPNASVIPMVINRSFAAKYDLKVGQNFEAWPRVKTLYYLNDKNVLAPLPKDSWYYGTDPTSGSATGKKAVWNNSATKWNYRGKQPIENTNYDDSYGYNYNGVYDKDGHRILSEDPKAWNNINDIWLKLPDDINPSAKKGLLRTADGKDKLAFNVNNVAYKDGSDWIRPFSFRVTDYWHDQGFDPITILTSRIPEWYGAMLDQGLLVVQNNINPASIKSDIENKMPDWWKALVGTTPIVKYHIIGVQDSYDTPRAYIDQKWANSILGYSYYQDRASNKDPTYANGVYQWFSGKLSAADDIYDIIGRMSFKRSSDDYTMYSMLYLNHNDEIPLIANSDLLQRKKEMLDKMSDIALSASLLFIVTTIICSILIVIMITDSFTDQFRRFMSHMKAEGYTNREINSFTLGIFTPWVILGYIIGYALGFLTVYGFIKVVSTVAGLAFPFTFIWWIIPLSFVLIAIIYLSTYVINTMQLNKMNLIELLNTDE